MTRLFAFITTTCLLTAALSAPALAQSVPADPNLPGVRLGPKAPMPAPKAAEPESMDSLFEQLRMAEDHRTAKVFEKQIWRRWLQSGSPTVDLLMARAVKAMETKKYPLALDVLDRIIRLKPDYAEGWNKRATVYFLTGDYAKSISDIEQTLTREPRHFGAISGMGMILRGLDKKEKAIKAFKQALDIYPTMPGPKEALEKLSVEVEGREI